jgi:hypothetical protein
VDAWGNGKLEYEYALVFLISSSTHESFAKADGWELNIRTGQAVLEQARLDFVWDSDIVLYLLSRAGHTFRMKTITSLVSDTEPLSGASSRPC